nr:hypothetical protein BaRGS_000227 [Batillaria attramentaria]
MQQIQTQLEMDNKDKAQIHWHLIMLEAVHKEKVLLSQEQTSRGVKQKQEQAPRKVKQEQKLTILEQAPKKVKEE